MISIDDPRRGERAPSRTEKQRFEVERKGSIGARKIFGGPANEEGRKLDFRAAKSVISKTSGMAGTLDLYSSYHPSSKSEAERRIGALSPAVAKLAETSDLPIDALEVLSLIDTQSRMSGGPVAVQRGEIARALNTTPERAEAIISELDRRGMIRRQPVSGTVAYYRPSL